MFDLLADDYSHIEIVANKYTYMSETALRGLCLKCNIPIFWGEKQKNIALKLIPKALCSDNFLNIFYHALQPKEKKILIFIVRYNGNDIEKAVKKKFQFEIVLMKTRTLTTYVWWLELFMDNNHFDSTLKDFFLKFLSEDRQKKNKNTKEISRPKEIEVVQTTKDLQTVMIDKVSISGQAYPQNLQELKPQDAILAIQVLYILSRDSKLKITQKGTIDVRHEKLLIEKMPQGFNYIWLLNFLSMRGCFVLEQLRIPTSKFIKLVNNSDADIVKILFNEFIDAKEMYELEYAMFHVSKVKGEYVKLMREMVLNIIKEEEDTTLWLNVDYIVDKIKISSETLKYITNNYIYCYGFYGNSNRISYNKIEHLKVVVRYFVKIFVGIMNGFGLCSLGKTEYQTFNQQDIRIIRDEKPRTYANVEFFKLSDLGHYVLGLENEFKNANDYKLILNSYILEIKVENKNNLSDIFLENIAIKVDDSKYKTDVKTFMQHINSSSEYENIKNAFIQKCDEVPQIWKQFFETMKERSSGASLVSQSAVLIKLQNNKELLKLISTHEKLKTKILKADNLHIVVLKSDLPYVKKTLKEYGILI